MPNIRLTKGGAYTSDISSLCSRIRANGTRATLETLTVSHPLAAGTVDLQINLAFEANASLPAANASLYTVAFNTSGGIFHFNVGNIGTPLPGQVFPGNLDGSYASLGYASTLPSITDINLAAAVDAVRTYAGAAPVPQSVLDGMARLIIAVSEAARFAEVKGGVNGVLGNTGTYAPPRNTINNWGGHTLSS